MDSLEIDYAYGLEKDSLGNYVANRWGSYHLKSNSWRLQFLDGFFGNNDYNDIYREVKENCEFSKIIEFNDSTELVMTQNYKACLPYVEMKTGQSFGI